MKKHGCETTAKRLKTTARDTHDYKENKQIPNDYKDTQNKNRDSKRLQRLIMTTRDANDYEETQYKNTEMQNNCKKTQNEYKEIQNKNNGTMSFFFFFRK